MSVLAIKSVNPHQRDTWFYFHDLIKPFFLSLQGSQLLNLPCKTFYAN